MRGLVVIVLTCLAVSIEAYGVRIPDVTRDWSFSADWTDRVVGIVELHHPQLSNDVATGQATIPPSLVGTITDDYYTSYVFLGGRPTRLPYRAHTLVLVAFTALCVSAGLVVLCLTWWRRAYTADESTKPVEPTGTSSLP